MRRTVVLNVVGLTPALLGESTPHLSDWARRGQVTTVRTVTPAVTCPVQATYLTGEYPRGHGIVGNGWYFRDECEIRFWRQSNKLVQVPKVWDMARELDPTFTCANLFWWYNMYSSVDYSITPRPMYPADGRKIPDVYTHPAALRFEIQEKLGGFPLFSFWGPGTSIQSSQWIARTAREVEQKYAPTLTLVYLPHLDYNLQRLGPNHPAIREDLRQIDAVCGELIAFFESREIQVIVLSEYGIMEVSRAIPVNQILRKHGLIAVREELGRELLDAGASAAFAVADHQIAHIYLNDPTQTSKVRAILEEMEGVEIVLDRDEKEVYHLNHPRAGDLIAITRSDAWFTYDYWLDERRAPDFARTVDIHRKPGYDPVELFLDPAIRFPRLKIGWILLKKKLGFRYLMDVIPLDPSLVKGSHGRVTDSPAAGPLFITQQSHLLDRLSIEATDVCHLILSHLCEG